MSLTNLGPALGRSCLLLISSKLLTLSSIPPFFTNLFRLAFLLALLVGLNLFFLIGALAWFFKIKKVVPLESVEVFRKDPFLTLFFSLSSSIIFRFLCLLFILARVAPAFLPTALSVALRPLFFQQAQYAQVFPLKPALFCTLFAGLGNTINSAIFLLFSYCLILVLSSPPCPFLHLSFYLKLCGRSGRNCLLSPPALSRYNGSPYTRFYWGNDTADELARRGALLAPSAIPCSPSPLISRVHSCLISDWRRTVSSKFFDTQVSSISTEELVLPRHARCVLSRLRCNGHSLLLSSYLSRIGKIENPCCSACGHSSQDIAHLILHCPATDSLRRSLFDDSVFLYDLWSRPWGVARPLGLHGLPPYPHPSEGVG